MNEIKGLCEQIKRDVFVFNANMEPHIRQPNLVDAIREIIGKIEGGNGQIDDIFTSLCHTSDLFELLCFLKNNEEEVVKSTTMSPAVNNTDVYAILRNIDKCTYKIFSYVKHSDSDYKHESLKLLRKIVATDKPVTLIKDLVPESYQLFEKVNLGMLKMKDIPLDTIPAGAKVVSFTIPNTKQMMYSCNPLINRDFIKSKYDYNRQSGLRNEIVERFDNNQTYTRAKVTGGDEEEDEDDILIDEIMATQKDVEYSGEYVSFQNADDAPGYLDYVPFTDRLVGGSANKEIIGGGSVNKVKEGIVVEGEIDTYYQLLGERNGKKIYRELVDYDVRDSSRNYNYLGATMFVDNVENKRLNMLKSNHKIWKRNIVTRELLGEIKMKYSKNHRLGSAIFNTISPKISTDEEMLRLIACSMEFESNSNIVKANPTYLDSTRNFTKLSLI